MTKPVAGDFLDTNVLVYLAQGDVRKAERVEALLAVMPKVSVQVLNELANVLRRKASFTWAEVSRFLATIRELSEVSPLSVEVHDSGLSIARRYGLSVYDSMIVAAAIASGCQTLWSEDMHDGLVVDGRLEIRNPFRDTPLDPDLV